MKLLAALACVAASTATASATWTSDQPTTDADGTVRVPRYSLPESSLFGTDTRKVLRNERAYAKVQANAPSPCSSKERLGVEHMAAIRQCEADAFYQTPAYKHMRELYRVVITHEQIGGVDTEIFMPVDGIADKNAGRVLINVHGGAFQGGARTESHMESVPIASVARIKVVSIDYRQAPEYVFPSASEDVAKVYRELLKIYKPASIGIYGCSAGGLLAAETIAWFQKVKLSLPGAVGMLCAGATYWTEGDSGLISTAHGWWGAGDAIGTNPYFKGTSPNDPLAFPARSAHLMASFPPSLLIAGTRDVALSSVVHTQSLLVAQGVTTELHIWEGMGHAFFLDPDLPQSREVYAVTAKFFDTYLKI